MKTTNAQNHKLTTRPWRLAALFGVPATISLGIMLCIAARAQITPKHASVPTHQTLMSYATSKAAELPTPLAFPGTMITRMWEGARDEDSPVTRSLDHAYNPMTGGTWLGASMTARDAALQRWNSMTAAFLSSRRSWVASSSASGDGCSDSISTRSVAISSYSV